MNINNLQKNLQPYVKNVKGVNPVSSAKALKIHQDALKEFTTERKNHPIMRKISTIEGPPLKSIMKKKTKSISRPSVKPTNLPINKKEKSVRKKTTKKGEKKGAKKDETRKSSEEQPSTVSSKIVEL